MSTTSEPPKSVLPDGHSVLDIPEPVATAAIREPPTPDEVKADIRGRLSAVRAEIAVLRRERDLTNLVIKARLADEAELQRMVRALEPRKAKK